jgi:dTMP kinase
MIERGRFVVLEGGEGSGKSTQVSLLARRLRDAGRDVVETFEPGGTEHGAQIRALLLDDDSRLDARAELLLLAADRAQHVAEVVRPALGRGADVVCDRYAPSTLAYQGRGRGLGVDAVGPISHWASAGLDADLVVVLDVSDEESARRRPTAADRFERAPADFHRVVREAYRQLARSEGWTLVDGTGSPGEVAQRVWSAFAARFDTR